MFRTAPQNACCRMAINIYPNKKHLLQAKPVNAFVRVAVVTCKDSIKVVAVIQKRIYSFCMKKGCMIS